MRRHLLLPTFAVALLLGCQGGGSGSGSTAGSTGPAASSRLSVAAGGPCFPLTIQGPGLQGATAVRFNGQDALCFWAAPDGSRVMALAPPGVATGPVTVVTPSGTVDAGTFTVVGDPGADFASRDALPQTAAAPDTWCGAAWNNGWGPHPAAFAPAPAAPAGVDAAAWRRARLLAAALHFRGLPYQHHHIPAFDGRSCTAQAADQQLGPGLDCSNFTTWIHRYAFGHAMTSDVQDQADDPAAGRLLAAGETLQPGDLLYIRGSSAAGPITHVAIYVDPAHRIDEHGSGVDLRAWGTTGWPTDSFDHARRSLDVVP